MKNEIGGVVALMGEKGNANALVAKPEGKRPFGRLCIDGRIILK
jgi:hypothetical protein